jgi:hypothetical protein
MHPYFLYTLYRDRLEEAERRAALNRIFLERAVAYERRPSRLLRALPGFHPARRRRGGLRTDAYACR